MQNETKMITTKIKMTNKIKIYIKRQYQWLFICRKISQFKIISMAYNIGQQIFIASGYET